MLSILICVWDWIFPWDQNEAWPLSYSLWLAQKPCLDSWGG